MWCLAVTLRGNLRRKAEAGAGKGPQPRPCPKPPIRKWGLVLASEPMTRREWPQIGRWWPSGWPGRVLR